MGTLPGHHGIYVVRYVVDDSADPCVVTIHGPDDEAHHQGFLIPSSRQIAYQVQVDGEAAVWAQIRVRLAIWDGTNLVTVGTEVAGNPTVAGGQPGVPAWVQMGGTLAVVDETPTHWLLDVSLTAHDPRVDPDIRPDAGTVVYLDCAYIPESGLDPAFYSEPYLDGDQSYGRWEGEPHNSTSVHRSLVV